MTMTREELKRWRLKHRLSQAAVARLLRVTTTTVYRWEHDHHPIPELAALCLKLLPAGTIAQQRTRCRKRA